jgi:type IX secretion system PorP/SprF family membrane protein
MKKKVFTIITGLLFISVTIQSQQLYQLTQYMIRPVIYNPAVSGQKDAVCFYGSGRNQWIGFTDMDGQNVNPRNYIAGVTAPIYSMNSGIGFQYNMEQIGYQSRSDFRIDYAYKLELKNNQILSVGVSGQLSQLKLDVDKLKPIDISDPLVLKQGIQKDMLPEAGIGVFYSSGDTWWAGISAMNLLGSTAKLGNIKLNDQTTIIANGQYKINVIKERFRKLDLAPSFLVKTNFTNTQVELDLLAYVNTNYWFGTGYRLQDGVAIIGGAQINNFIIGISYDLTTGKVNEVTKAGTAELHLSYCLPVLPRSKSEGKLNKVKYHSGFNTRHL